MIDIGLTKIALIGVVALVVIGPEKLPRVARMVGTLFGRAQRYLHQVKAEVSREMELDELRKVKQEMQDAAGSVEQSIKENLRETEQSLQAAWNPEDNTLQSPPTSEQLALKRKDFRRKKLSRTSAIPSWYKRQHGGRSRIISASARVAKYRPAHLAPKSSVFFPR